MAQNKKNNRILQTKQHTHRVPATILTTTLPNRTMVEKTQTHNSKQAVPHGTAIAQTHQLRSKKEKKFS